MESWVRLLGMDLLGGGELPTGCSDLAAFQVDPGKDLTSTPFEHSVGAGSGLLDRLLAEAKSPVAVSSVHLDDRRDSGSCRSGLRRPGSTAKQGGEASDTLGLMGSTEPQELEMERQPQAGFGPILGARRPIQGDAEVAELAPKPLDRNPMVGLVHVVGLGAGDVEVEVEVTLPSIFGVLVGVEEFAGVLTDRLEQAIAGRVTGEVDRHEGGAHELVQDVDSLWTIVIEAHGGERGQLATAGERAQGVQRRLGMGREKLISPVERSAHRAMTRQGGVAGRRQGTDRVVEQVGELRQRQGSAAGCGKLEPERNPVDAATDGTDRYQVVASQD